MAVVLMGAAHRLLRCLKGRAIWTEHGISLFRAWECESCTKYSATEMDVCKDRRRMLWRWITGERVPLIWTSRVVVTVALHPSIELPFISPTIILTFPLLLFMLLSPSGAHLVGRPIDVPLLASQISWSEVISCNCRYP